MGTTGICTLFLLGMLSLGRVDPAPALVLVRAASDPPSPSSPHTEDDTSPWRSERDPAPPPPPSNGAKWLSLP